MHYIFHLSIPVNDQESAIGFYVNTLGGSTGRKEKQWVDILLWGHQLTLQHRPEEVLPERAQGKRHFGVILPWEEWEALKYKLETAGQSFLEKPEVLYPLTENEQAKLYLQDPANNIIEIKAYRNISNVLGINKD